MAKSDLRSYTTDAGTVVKIRMSLPVIAITGNDTTTALTDGNVEASVSYHGQKRRAGLGARGYVLGLPAVAPATGYTKKTFVPITTKAVFDAAKKGDNVTYLGGTYKIIDKIAEV
jgi:hypothetical protein